MALKFYSKDLDWEETIFMGAMYWRILYGTGRVYLGYKLLSLVGLPAVEAYQHLLRRELADTDDVLFQTIGHALMHHGFSITYFLAFYLLFWGAVDILLSISMLRHYLWAFSLSMVLITLFIFYEVFRFTHTHSPILLSIIIIDLVIIYLIYHERDRLIARRERKLQKQRNNSGTAGNRHEQDSEPADKAR